MVKTGGSHGVVLLAWIIIGMKMASEMTS